MRNGFRTFAKLLEEANEAAREAEHARNHLASLPLERRVMLALEWENSDVV